VNGTFGWDELRLKSYRSNAIIARKIGKNHATIMGNVATCVVNALMGFTDLTANFPVHAMRLDLKRIRIPYSRYFAITQILMQFMEANVCFEQSDWQAAESPPHRHRD
jgi:hypothetical protein